MAPPLWTAGCSRPGSGTRSAPAKGRCTSPGSRNTASATPTGPSTSTKGRATTYLLAGRRLLAGTGFRTDPRSHAEAQEFFGLPVTGLTLVDPRFYHLDTALAVLGDGDDGAADVMYYPGAFSPGSRAALAEMFPGALPATDEDAAVFGLNAFSDGPHVLLPDTATGLAAALKERGYEPIGVELSELLKAGGSVECCTSELRDAA
ncbi:hypothetical protein GCM10009863_12840 [Streptomyces axinellae]|uniref:Amidinotransferase n=1 Tax=Streptomyces axinellae TaxID=552788 RepID=A0ABP6C5Y3_9ACTN